MNNPMTHDPNKFLVRIVRHRVVHRAARISAGERP